MSGAEDGSVIGDVRMGWRDALQEYIQHREAMGDGCSPLLLGLNKKLFAIHLHFLDQQHKEIPVPQYFKDQVADDGDGEEYEEAKCVQSDKHNIASAPPISPSTYSHSQSHSRPGPVAASSHSPAHSPSSRADPSASSSSSSSSSTRGSRKNKQPSSSLPTTLPLRRNVRRKTTH